MDKQKRAKLLNRLDELQDSLPGDQLKAAFERMVSAKAEEFSKSAKSDVTINLVNEMSRKLDRFRRDFDLKGVFGDLDGLKDALAQMQDGMMSQLDARDQQAQMTRSELENLVKNTKEMLEGMTAREMASMARKMDSLESQLTVQGAEGEGSRQSLAQAVSEAKARLDAMGSDFEKYRKGSDDTGKGMDARIAASEDGARKFGEELSKLRQDFMSRLSNMGGGAPNQQINVKSSVMSTKYADINFRNGGGIVWAASDDNVNKRVDITASVVASGSGGSGTPGGNDTEIQFNDAGSFGGGSVLTWNKNSSVLTVQGGASVTGTLQVAGNGLVVNAGSNRVGIETSAPDVTLAVEGTTRVNSQLRLGVSGDDQYYVEKTNDDLRISTFDDIFFRVNGSDRMLMDTAALSPNANTGMGLGTTALRWNSLHLSSVAAITYPDYRVTHSASLLTFGLPGSIAGAVALAGLSGETTRIQPASVAGNWTMTLPPNDGSANQVLTTDGNGITSWASVAGGSGGMARVVSVISVSSTFASASATDYVAFANVGVAMTLPTAISNTNQYTVKNVSNSSVLVATSLGQTIDDQDSAVIPLKYQSLTFQSNNSVWGIV